MTQTFNKHNLYDEVIGMIEYLEADCAWSTDENKQWSDRVTAWMRGQINSTRKDSK